MNLTSTDANNKLIILYTLNKIGLPVNNIQLMEIILENKFMNYFTYQEVVKDLIELGFISSNQEEDSSSYTLTDTGVNCLNFFEGRIPLGIRKFLDNNTSSLKTKVLTDSFVLTNIVEEDNKFVVKCKISENDFSLIEINLTAGTRSDSQLICNNWKKYSEQIYTEIIESLTKKRA